MSLQSILNTNSPHAYKESEFDVFGVVGKLVIYVVHSFKRKKYFKIFLFSQSAQATNFWSQGFYGLIHVGPSTWT